MSTNEIINYIKQYYEDKKVYPTISEVSDFSKETPDTIRKIYKTYITSLRKNLVEHSEPKRLVIEKIETDSKPKFNNVKFIRIIMGIVGTILVVCSIHFTNDFNSLGMDKLWAFLISFALVVFTSFALTMAVLVGKKTSRLVYFLWIIGVLYSIFTAIASQYNDFRKYNAVDNSQSVNVQEQLYNEKLEELKSKRESLLHWRDKEKEYTENPDLKIENPKTWSSIKYGVNELKTVENEIDKTRNSLLNLSTENVEENKTIYHWLSKILHVNGDLLQFIIIVFPSVFLDLCAGILLKFAFITVDDIKKE